MSVIGTSVTLAVGGFTSSVRVTFTRSWEGQQLLAYVESHLKLSLH